MASRTGGTSLCQLFLTRGVFASIYLYATVILIDGSPTWDENETSECTTWKWRYPRNNCTDFSSCWEDFEGTDATQKLYLWMKVLVVVIFAKKCRVRVFWRVVKSTSIRVLLWHCDDDEKNFISWFDLKQCMMSSIRSVSLTFVKEYLDCC